MTSSPNSRAIRSRVRIAPGFNPILRATAATLPSRLRATTTRFSSSITASG
jgi:hypothetical protein